MSECAHERAGYFEDQHGNFCNWLPKEDREYPYEDFRLFQRREGFAYCPDCGEALGSPAEEGQSK